MRISVNFVSAEGGAMRGRNVHGGEHCAVVCPAAPVRGAWAIKNVFKSDILKGPLPSGDAPIAMTLCPCGLTQMVWGRLVGPGLIPRVCGNQPALFRPDQKIAADAMAHILSILEELRHRPHLPKILLSA